MRRLAKWLLLTVAVFLCVPEPVLGDPPSWAPAHGWRKKQRALYVGYEGKRWPSDYGVIRGDCDRRAIGAVLGGAIGGVVGSRVGRGEDRAVAILVGTVVGAVIGAEVGKRMDEQDRGCLGQALELTERGKPVMWSNGQSATTFILTPLAEFARDGRPCREFALDVRTHQSQDVSRQSACRLTSGEWQLTRR